MGKSLWGFMGVPTLADHTIYLDPSGFLTVRHGIDDPFIDGLPITNGDFPWQTVNVITSW